MNTEEKLKQLGIELLELSKPKYTYVPFRRAGEVVFLAGQVPKLADGTFLTGKIGADRTVAEGQEAARICAINMLAAARAVTGSLDDIEFVKVLVMVNAVADFRDHALVAEGFSQLIVNVLGDKGQHARSAVGMGSLPGDIRVEVEAILRVIG